MGTKYARAVRDAIVAASAALALLVAAGASDAWATTAMPLQPAPPPTNAVASGATTIELAGPWRSDGRFLRDRYGRVVIFHGVNMVWKHAPYVPPSQLFGSPLTGSYLDLRDAQWLAQNGFNAVRLGVLWAGVEPRPGRYDRTHLQKMRRLAQMLGEHDVAVLVDSHQDMYSEAYRGEGFPDWTRLDRGTRVTNCCRFPLNYASPSSAAVWNDFWRNRARLWTRFRVQWTYVTRYMRSLPNVIGYDLINEPWPGSSWRRCLLPGGCAAQDLRLQRMQEHVANGIRALDSKTPIWWEGSTLTAFGADNRVGARRRLAVRGGNTVLSFHAYCLLGGSVPFITRDDDPTCTAVQRRTFNTASRARARNRSAHVLTEFGASDELGDIARVTTLADSNMTSWFYWHYGSWADPTGVAATQGLFADDLDRPGSLKQAKADVLVRTYPQAVAGVPITWSFDPFGSARRFQMWWVPDLRISQPTVISVPVQRHYPGGYDVYVSGPVRVTSAANAPLLTIEQTVQQGAAHVVVVRHGASLV